MICLQGAAHLMASHRCLCHARTRAFLAVSCDYCGACRTIPGPRQTNRADNCLDAGRRDQPRSLRAFCLQPYTSRRADVHGDTAALVVANVSSTWRYSVGVPSSAWLMLPRFFASGDDPVDGRKRRDVFAAVDGVAEEALQRLTPLLLRHGRQ